VFDAVVLAVSPHANEKLLGITLVERGRRMISKAGARRVYVVDSTSAAAALVDWDRERGDADLVVVRAGDQLVHMPLVKPLLTATGERRAAITPSGEFAGALYLAARHAPDAIAAITSAPATADRDLASRYGAAATKVPHGDIAVHAATTPAERKGAAKMLLQLLVKAAEDSPVSRYIYRPLSRPITRALLHTKITPNQVSYFVGVLGLAGCVLTALPSQSALIWGAFLVFVSCIIDGCDGEIARMKLQFSPFGAWLDTVIDEITQVCYFLAIGYHTYQHHPSTWLGGSIGLGFLCYVATIYAIYFFSLVVIKQGGSQYYVGDVELVDLDGAPALRPRLKVSTAPPWLKSVQTLFLYMIRRDFINVAALVIAFFDGYAIIYAGIWLGTVVAAMITVPEHLKLRTHLREIRRRGAPLRYVSS
jgi:phosphatidylglycerophosphate synthase